MGGCSPDRYPTTRVDIKILLPGHGYQRRGLPVPARKDPGLLRTDGCTGYLIESAVAVEMLDFAFFDQPGKITSSETFFASSDKFVG